MSESTNIEGVGIEGVATGGVAGEGVATGGVATGGVAAPNLDIQEGGKISTIIDNFDLRYFYDNYLFEIILVFLSLCILIYILYEKEIITFEKITNLINVNNVIKLIPKAEYILNHSFKIYIDNDYSKENMIKIDDIYKKYNLSINKINLLQTIKDKEELSKMPLIYDKIVRYSKDKIAPEEYELAGTFYKCLSHAKDNRWGYLLFLENDSIPILPPDEFIQKFNEVIESLPDNGDGLFMLSCTVDCKSDNDNDYNKWMKHSDIVKQKNLNVYGSHALLISKRYIFLLMDYITQNKINDSIDIFIHKMNPWIWYGDLSENGMFRGLYQRESLNCEYKYDKFIKKI